MVDHGHLHDRCDGDIAEGANFVIFDRAGDSTGGVKEEKGLWLACQSTGNSTGGRAHLPTSFAVRAKESSTCACFRANAWK